MIEYKITTYWETKDTQYFYSFEKAKDRFLEFTDKNMFWLNISHNWIKECDLPIALQINWKWNEFIARDYDQDTDEYTSIWEDLFYNL